VYGDGASGPAYSMSDTITFMPVPSSLSTSNIGKYSVVTHWAALPCADVFKIQYKSQIDENWSTIIVPSHQSSYKLTNLSAGTTYQCMISAEDTLNGYVAASAYSAIQTFTTNGTAAKQSGMVASEAMSDKLQNTKATVYPNPATTVLHVQLNGLTQKNNASLTLILKDMSGKAVWSAQHISSSSMDVNVSKLPSGFYYLQIFSADNKQIQTEKVIITR